MTLDDCVAHAYFAAVCQVQKRVQKTVARQSGQPECDAEGMEATPKRPRAAPRRREVSLK